MYRATKPSASARIAIIGVVTRRTAAIVFIELTVRISDAAASEIEADLVVFAIHLGVPKSGLDDFELAVNKYLLHWSIRITAGSRNGGMLRVDTLSASRLSGP
jgi:hypothetical protein